MFTFFFQAEDGIRDRNVTGVQTCALPIYQKCSCIDYSPNVLFFMMYKHSVKNACTDLTLHPRETCLLYNSLVCYNTTKVFVRYWGCVELVYCRKHFISHHLYHYEYARFSAKW